MNILFENIEMGEDVYIHPSAKIQGVSGKGKSIKIGDNVYIGERVQIMVDEFEIGDYSKIHHDTNLHGKKSCKIGCNAWIGQFCIIDSTGGVDIGNNFGLGAHSQIWSHMKYGDTLEGCFWNRSDKILIENDVWLVGHVIFCGTTALERSMALVGSVVTQPMEANCVYAGVPATIKKGLKQFASYVPDKLQKMTEHMFNSRVTNIAIHSHVREGVDYFADNVSYFFVDERVYTKKRTPNEIEFMKYLLPERAKFVPL